MKAILITKEDIVRKAKYLLSITNIKSVKWKINKKGFQWQGRLQDITINDYARLCQIGLLVSMFEISEKELEGIKG